MPQQDDPTDREKVNKFIRAVDECFKRIGNQRLALDVEKLSELVAETPLIAARYVEAHCMGAYSQPSLIKVPFIIATILKLKHSMPEPLALVEKTAEQIGAADLLSRIPIAADESVFRAEGPERDAAKRWWDAVNLNVTTCDGCDNPVRRGQGFAVPSSSGSGAGIDLLCQSCFDLHLSRTHAAGKH